MKLFKSVSLIVGALVIAQGAVAQGNADAGKNKVAVCGACHGTEGVSTAPIYPNLAGLGEKYLLKQLQDVKAGDRAIPEMTGMLNAYSDQDLADIAAFYDSQPAVLTGAKEAKVLVNTGEEVDALKLGENLYRFGNASTNSAPCSGCHSPTGKGNAPAGYPMIGGQHADYIVKQLQDFRAGRRTNDGETSIMRGVAKNLSDAEITAVANYVSGLH